MTYLARRITYLTTDQFADWIGKSTDTVRRLVLSGELRECGVKGRISADAIEEYCSRVGLVSPFEPRTDSRQDATGTDAFFVCCVCCQKRFEVKRAK